MHPAAVARVELKLGLQDQIPLNRVAAAERRARDGCLPGLAREAGRDLAEAEMIEAGRDIQSRPHLVAAFGRRGDGPQRQLARGRAQQRQRPVADDGFEPEQIVVARILDVGAPRGLREILHVGFAERRADRHLTDERAAGAGPADDEAGDRMQGRRARRSAVRRCRRAAAGWTACPPVIDAGRVDHIVAGVNLHAGVPAEGVGERHTAILAQVADRKIRQPAPAAHADQFVGADGQGIRPDGGQVLIRQRIADERVVRGVGAPGKRAEGRRHAADLDVEGARGPRPDAEVQAVGFRPSAVLAPHLGEQRHMIARLHRRHHGEAQHPQRRVLVVGVVEEAGVLRCDRPGHVAAERDAAVAEDDRRGRERLRTRGRAEAQHQRPGAPARRFLMAVTSRS